MTADRTAAARRALTQAETAIAKARAALNSPPPEPAADVDDSPLGRMLAGLDAARALISQTGITDVSVDVRHGGRGLRLSVDSAGSLRELFATLQVDRDKIACHRITDSDSWYINPRWPLPPWAGADVDIFLIANTAELRAEVRAWLEPLGVTMPAEPLAVAS